MGIGNEVGEITQALKDGMNVVVFPEATSTNGESVIRFRRPLFQAAFNSGLNVLPLCLNYKSLDDEEITLKNRDPVFWYDDTPFGTHALRLLSRKKLVVELSVMEIIDIKKFPSKNELSEHCFNVIHSHYKKII